MTDEEVCWVIGWVDASRASSACARPGWGGKTGWLLLWMHAQYEKLKAKRRALLTQLNMTCRGQPPKRENIGAAIADLERRVAREYGPAVKFIVLACFWRARHKGLGCDAAPKPPNSTPPSCAGQNAAGQGAGPSQPWREPGPSRQPGRGTPYPASYGDDTDSDSDYKP